MVSLDGTHRACRVCISISSSFDSCAQLDCAGGGNAWEYGGSFPLLPAKKQESHFWAKTSRSRQRPNMDALCISGLTQNFTIVLHIPGAWFYHYRLNQNYFKINSTIDAAWML